MTAPAARGPAACMLLRLDLMHLMQRNTFGTMLRSGSRHTTATATR